MSGSEADMSLRELIQKYLAVAGAFGKSVAIASLGLSKVETEKAFDILDEDYHISRFFHFLNEAGESFQINGFPQTHVAIDSEIESIL
jgi:hypothetical protein